MNVSLKNKIKFKNSKKIEFQKRVLTGKKQKLSQEEKLILIKNAQKERDDYENKHLGNFVKLYPFGDDSEKIYDEFIQYAQKLYEEWTGTSFFRPYFNKII